jgi:hypothetical protein
MTGQNLLHKTPDAPPVTTSAPRPIVPNVKLETSSKAATDVTSPKVLSPLLLIFSLSVVYIHYPIITH